MSEKRTESQANYEEGYISVKRNKGHHWALLIKEWKRAKV